MLDEEKTFTKRASLQMVHCGNVFSVNTFFISLRKKKIVTADILCKWCIQSPCGKVPFHDPAEYFSHGCIIKRGDTDGVEVT